MRDVKKPEVVAIIPARKGSKGIPLKNITPLGGYPLIAYTIEDALQSRLVTKVIVSTDCEEIAEVAVWAGAEVPFLRPESMATDVSLIGEAFSYTKEQLKKMGIIPDVTVELYPTSPFRPEGLIDHLVSKALEGQSPASTFKPVRYTSNDFIYSKEGKAHPLLDPSYRSGCAFRQYGLCTATLNGGGIPYSYVIDDPVYLVDIDTPEDLAVAEEILRSGLFVPRFDKALQRESAC